MSLKESKFLSQFATISENDILKLDSTAAFVLHLNNDSPVETIEFILSKLKTNHLNIQRIILDNDKKNNILFLVTCYETLILKHSKIVYQKQQLKRQFDDYDKFVDAFDTSIWNNEELNDSERQRIIQNILEGIRIDERSTLVGMDSVKCYSGQSLVELCYRENVILDYFPLHDPLKLKQLRANIFESFRNNINSVRNYFGEKIAFYFSFLKYYTNLFAVITFLTLIEQFLFSKYWLFNETVTMLNCMLLFIFWKLWIRESNSLAFRWGTLEAFELENARPTFRSKNVELDPITQQLLPCYPIKKTWFKEYFISLPIVLLSVYLAFEVMCIYFSIEDWTISIYNENPSFVMNIVTYLPSIVYTVLIVFCNKNYRILAEWLNEYENHRTQASHDNHLIIKLVLFEFMNNFMSLFYIAFYLNNIEMLKWNLFTMLTINQFADNMLEVILPYLRIYLKSRNKSQLKIKDLLKLESCTDIYYDYLELFIQFGFVFLFLPVFPYGPLIAMLNSIFEVFLDGLKFCYCYKRPIQRPAKGINNGWIVAFQFLTIIITITNLALIGFHSQNFTEIAQYFGISNFTLMVVVEHILFILILVIWSIIPDLPKIVSLQQSRQRYLNLKNLENLKKND